MIDYLKIEMDGDDWLILESVLDSKSIESVKQIGVRLREMTKHQLFRYQQLFQQLERLGFTRFFSRKNYWSNNSSFAGYEMAWFNSFYEHKC